MKTDANAPDMIVAVEHHAARIFQIDIHSHDVTEHTLKPHDTDRLSHKNEDRERGERASADPAFYEQIAQVLTGGNRIVIVGHGTGQSNAGHQLAEHLRAKHKDIAQHIHEVTADLSAVTDKQLIALGREALH